MCYFAKRFQTVHRQLAHKGDAANSFFDRSNSYPITRYAAMKYSKLIPFVIFTPLVA